MYVNRCKVAQIWNLEEAVRSKVFLFKIDGKWVSNACVHLNPFKVAQFCDFDGCFFYAEV